MSYSFKYRRKDDSSWSQYLARVSQNITSLEPATIVTITTILTYLLVVFIGAYVLLRRTGILPPNALRKIIWRVFVYIIPPSLVIALEKREAITDSNDPFESENSYGATRTFGAKSLAVKKILGLSNIVKAAGNMNSSGGQLEKKIPALPGLFNRDNECYQNSIIQGLASLPSFCEFLQKLPSSSPTGGHATLTGALQAIVNGLNSPDNHGRGLWTPWALKSMSSWQQQDAQEYYSRVIDEVEKDIKNTLKAEIVYDGSLASLNLRDSDEPEKTSTEKEETTLGEPNATKPNLAKIKNPLEGLQAQRVGCLQCGYVEGFSLIPFNCMTLSLGRKNEYDLEGLLDSFVDLETISGVECAKCTLLKTEKLLQGLIVTRYQGQDIDTDFVKSAENRLAVIQAALDTEVFSEETLSKKCQIPGKARVCTDKTKQVVIARIPKSLTIHVNRSVFDERTGTQLKNYSHVHFPKLLSLDRWCLGAATSSSDVIEKWETDPSVSMISRPEDTDDEKTQQLPSQSPKALYKLRALITHYGTHGDGHYVAWRQDLAAVGEDNENTTWWRLSDDDVVEFDEETVLKQGGVFMLFYDQVDADDTSLQDTSLQDPMSEPEHAAEISTTDEKPATEETQNPNSPSAFLPLDMRAALDAKLAQYSSPRETPVLSNGHIKVSAQQNRDLDGITSSMRTASEAKSIVLDPVGGMLDVA